MSKNELNPASFKIPDGFKELMEKYMTEVLRFQPENIPEFSRQYFSALYDNQLPQFLSANNDALNNNLKTLQDYAEVSDRSDLGAYNTEDPTEKEIYDLHKQYNDSKSQQRNEPEPDSSMYSAAALDVNVQENDSIKRGGSQRVYKNRDEDDNEDEEILALQAALREQEEQEAGDN